MTDADERSQMTDDYQNKYNKTKQIKFKIYRNKWQDYDFVYACPLEEMFDADNKGSFSGGYVISLTVQQYFWQIYDKKFGCLSSQQQQKL